MTATAPSETVPRACTVWRPRDGTARAACAASLGGRRPVPRSCDRRDRSTLPPCLGHACIRLRPVFSVARASAVTFARKPGVTAFMRGRSVRLVRKGCERDACVRGEPGSPSLRLFRVPFPLGVRVALYVSGPPVTAQLLTGSKSSAMNVRIDIGTSYTPLKAHAS